MSEEVDRLIESVRPEAEPERPPMPDDVDQLDKCIEWVLITAMLEAGVPTKDRVAAATAAIKYKAVKMKQPVEFGEGFS